MFDVRSLLDELLRGDPRPTAETLAAADKAQAPPRARHPLREPQNGHGDGAGASTTAPLPHAAGEARPLGADVPGLQTSPHPAAGRDALEVPSLKELLGRLVESASLAPEAGQSHAGGGGLGDLLGKLEQQAREGRGGLLDALGQVLGQAAAGVREAAGRLDETTGASKVSREAIAQMTGKSPEQLVVELKALLADNQLAAGAALGGLGALILGTPAGRSLAATAAKLGGLALIGGLAYQAYQAYQDGRPVLQGPPSGSLALAAAPAGSGFEPGALSNDRASLLIRTMIAAAAADGRIDQSERQRILDKLRQAPTSPEAQRFLMQEVQRPAAASELAREVSSLEQASEVYTAARIAIDLDSEEEHAFLKALADQLGIDGRLAAHIDAAARGASA
jgi:uncharacterized membrane protein YebE (DUF533 family)